MIAERINMNNEHDNSNDIFRGYGVRIAIKTDFNKIREVLTRIGIISYKRKTITQTCLIFHKREQYAIMHFKEMFLFDNKEADLTEEDIQRRNFIVKVLYEWGHIEILDSNDKEMILSAKNTNVTILTRDCVENNHWKRISNYTLGKNIYNTEEY